MKVLLKLCTVGLDEVEGISDDFTLGLDEDAVEGVDEGASETVYCCWNPLGAHRCGVSARQVCIPALEG